MTSNFKEKLLIIRSRPFDKNIISKLFLYSNFVWFNVNLFNQAITVKKASRLVANEVCRILDIDPVTGDDKIHSSVINRHEQPSSSHISRVAFGQTLADQQRSSGLYFSLLNIHFTSEV